MHWTSLSNYCFVLLLNFVDCLYSRCLRQTTLPVYRHADWAAELSNLGSSTWFQAHSCDFVSHRDNRFQRDVFGMLSNTFNLMSQYCCLLFTWKILLLSWIFFLELFMKCPRAELQARHFTMQLALKCQSPDKTDQQPNRPGDISARSSVSNTKNIDSVRN